MGVESDPGVAVCLEIGKLRVFASALCWPGWARIGGSEDAAIAALEAYASRYRLGLSPPRPPRRSRSR
jgi:hypothetical protein